MLNYYAVEKANQQRIADMQRAVARERLAKLAMTAQPQHVGRTRTALGQLVVRLGTRIAPPAQPLAPRPETV